MVTARATGLRLTCNVIGPRNHLGNERLVATLLEDGIQVWCKHCCKPYFVSRETCEAAWEHGTLMLVGCGHHSEE